MTNRLTLLEKALRDIDHLEKMAKDAATRAKNNYKTAQYYKRLCDERDKTIVEMRQKINQLSSADAEFEKLKKRFKRHEITSSGKVKLRPEGQNA
jgi:chlorite dismutase